MEVGSVAGVPTVPNSHKAEASVVPMEAVVGALSLTAASSRSTRACVTHMVEIVVAAFPIAKS
ncbi:hypothetical protein P3T76_008859 [Phytophthora citrophthora]|uniref:Uncharacterized protein n=1 Tax=Phytophthora citrophthora TaxID=4793 RepID=A0AAD9LKP8_9STRA|nr:hypothetical protein P3T76_008859 [Phytophthora citrophthora]